MRTIVVTSMLLLATACSAEPGPIVDPGTHVDFSSTGQQLTARVADSEEERRRGLMGVESLGANQGMVFLFDEPTAGSFWMKDTLIPLAIAFVDEGGRIVGIEEMTPCTVDPCPTWDAGGAEYAMAIEANAGWFGEHGVTVGDTVELRSIGYA